MTLRDTVTKWHAAICLLEENRFNEAIQKFLEIEKPSSRIIYNLGCICMLQNKYQEAIQYFNKSLVQDKYLAITHCQRGVCYYELQQFDFARTDFISACSLLRSDVINYKQLGADILLTPELLNQYVAVTEECSKKKSLVKLPNLPVRNCIFRPPKTVVDNLVKQDFIGNAKVISSTQEKDIMKASENKKLQPHIQTKNQTSVSMPSSPTPTRYQLNASGAKKVIIPPPPNRPPPRLPDSVMATQRLRVKSKSLEDLSAADIVSQFDEVDSSPTPKTISANNNSSASDSSKLHPSKHPLSNQGNIPLLSSKSANCDNVSQLLPKVSVPKTVENSRQQDIPAPATDESAEEHRNKGHANRMRSLFERLEQQVESDEKFSPDRTRISSQKNKFALSQLNRTNGNHIRKDTAQQGTSSQQNRLAITQCSSENSIFDDSSASKLPKPTRPPPPKFTK